jgi:hypothetical protein
MSTSRGDVLALFSDEADALEDEPDTAAGKRHLRRRQRALEQAAWCLRTGQSVEAYLRLTRVERNAFTDLLDHTT